MIDTPGIRLLRLRLLLSLAGRLTGLSLLQSAAAARNGGVLLLSGYGSPRTLLRLCFRHNACRDFSILKKFLTRSRAVDEEPVRTIVPGIAADTPGPRQFLGTTRATGLQRLLADRYFRRQFGISPDPIALDTLSRCPSVTRTAAELIRAAGCGAPASLTSEDLHRCRTVFPAFIRLLRLDLGFHGTGVGPQHAALRLKAALRRGCSRLAFRRRLSVPRLYPKKLLSERRKFARTKLETLYSDCKQTAARSHTAALFSLYLDTLQIIIDALPRIRNVRRMERILNRIERYHTGTAATIMEEEDEYME